MIYYVIIAIIIMSVKLFIYSKWNQKQPAPKKLNIPYPQCPDYWESISANKCKNVHKLGQCRLGNDPDNTIDFNTRIFLNDVTGNYMKCKWATDCNVSWEGINKLC